MQAQAMTSTAIREQPRVRRTTRGVSQTTTPRSTRSTRSTQAQVNKTVTTQQARSTRTRSTRSTRSAITQTTSVTTPNSRVNHQTRRSTRKDEGFKFFKEDAFKREPKPKKPIILYEPVSEKTRTAIMGQLRKQQKAVAPLNFVLAMFFAVCIFVFAFSLLHRDDVSVNNGTPYAGKVGDEVHVVNPNTSTNTSILQANKK